MKNNISPVPVVVGRSGFMFIDETFGWHFNDTFTASRPLVRSTV